MPLFETLSQSLTQISLISWAILLTASLIAGIVRGFSGFGTGMIIVPTVAFAFNPVVAITTLMIIDLFAQYQLLRANWTSIRWSKVIWLLVGTGIAMPLGIGILTSIDENTLKQAYSFIVLVLVIIMASGWRYQGNGTPIKDLSVGVIGGVGAGAAGMGGPPVILYALASSDDTALSRGRIIGYLAGTTILMITMFTVLGVFTWFALAVSLVGVPLYLIGNAIGQAIFPLASEATYRRIALVILTIIALLTLYASFA